MRIAVCLSGAERFDSHALTLLTRNLPADVDVDCFCYVWEGGPIGDEATLVEAVKSKAEGRFRTVKAAVGRAFHPGFDLVVQVYSETNIENVLRMFQAIQRCNNMKLHHEVEHGFTYDCVIRTRSDLSLSSEVGLGCYLPLMRDFIVFPENGHHRGGLNDQFAFSSSANMDAYASVADHIVDHCKNGCVFHPETLLRFHLLRMRKLAILAPISATVIRE